MMLVTAIAARKDVNPEEGKRKYGNVQYADPKNKKYPIDKEHIHAALSYWGMSKNRAKYSPADQKLIGARIRAAAKRHGVEVSHKPGCKDNVHCGPGGRMTGETPLIVTCELPYTQRFDGEAPSQILYLPKGRSVINARVNGEPQTVAVDVDEGVTGLLQADLKERLAQPVRPTGGFNHKRDGPASFIPTGFIWDDKRGVVLNVNWTKSGRDAIEGRDYSYFSPTFRIKEDKPTGLCQQGEVGSLTNSPAFEQIGALN